MTRKTKCQWCNVKDNTKKIKGTKGYYHQECYDQMEKQKEQWTNLIEVIMDIHGIVDKGQIPRDFYVVLNKFAKTGFSYEVLRKAYEYVKSDIRKWVKIRDIESTKGELMYGFKVMQDKVKHIQKKIEEEEKYRKKFNQSKDKNELNYKKRERKDDISEFV